MWNTWGTVFWQLPHVLAHVSQLLSGCKLVCAGGSRVGRLVTLRPSPAVLGGTHIRGHPAPPTSGGCLNLTGDPSPQRLMTASVSPFSCPWEQHRCCSQGSSVWSPQGTIGLGGGVLGLAVSSSELCPCLGTE